LPKRLKNEVPKPIMGMDSVALQIHNMEITKNMKHLGIHTFEVQVPKKADSPGINAKQ